MKVVNEDAELASEMVVLFGRELKVARGQIRELEMRLKEKPQILPHADQKDLIRKLEDELLKQRERTSIATTAHLSALARAEAAEKALEVHAEEIAKVTDFEHTLASYKGKYIAEREAKRTLRHTCQCRELQAQLNSITSGEKETSQRKSEAHQGFAVLVSPEESSDSDMQKIAKDKGGKYRGTADGSLRDSARETYEYSGEGDSGTAAAKHLEIDVVTRFIKKLPSPGPATRPPYTCLAPICQNVTDLHSHLTSVLGSLCPENIFYFPNRMKITQDNYHAVVFSPTRVFVKGRWIQPWELTFLPGQARALFYLHENLVFYVGDYRCHRSEEWFPDKLPEYISQSAIVDIALSSKTSRSKMRTRVKEQFLTGRYKVQCMVLECIDFDHTLYDTLLNHRPELTRKRRAGTANIPPAKKARRD